jgi:cyclophilin family peptidyl-prolyl cis-trans isomerase
MRKVLAFAMLCMLGLSTIQAQDTSGPIVLISTNYGDIKLKLYNATPLHRDNFLEIAKAGQYDGSIFHRVINRFMIQGGGSEGAAVDLDKRPTIPAEIVTGLIHKKGALAAARTGDQVNPERRSSGSQFYIVQGQKYDENTMKMMESRLGHGYNDEQRKAYAELGGTPHLDYQYTIFGEVIEGLEVVDKIAAVPTQPGDRPTTPVSMKVKVIKK